MSSFPLIGHFPPLCVCVGVKLTFPPKDYVLRTLIYNSHHLPMASVASLPSLSVKTVINISAAAVAAMV